MLYQRPDDKVMSMVKAERFERSEFRAKLKESKRAGMRERLESIAFLDDNGNFVDIAPADDDDGEMRDS